VEEQLAVAVRLVVLHPGLVARIDAGADEPDLPLAHVRVRLLQAGAALTQPFTSLPVSTRPASKRLRKWCSCRALRLSAMSFTPRTISRF
jgi:hypothetical protein